MTRTVDQGFSEFLETLVPRFSETDAAAANQAAIERCLTDAFNMSYLAPYGSTGHGTNVEGFSAIDCFAVIRSSTLDMSADASLDALHGALSEKFPDAYVTEGRPFVAVPFGESPAEQHHVVPAYSIGKQGDYDVFGIPGPADRWIEACPGGHSAWINEVHESTGRRLKPFVRLVKAWNYLDGQPVWSFYLELRVAEFLQGTSSVNYPSDIMLFFKRVADMMMDPFEGAEGSNEPVYGSSADGRAHAINRLRAAKQVSRQARECEAKGQIADAFHAWRKLYDWRFPTY
jgi:hypothetical protein